MAIQTDCDGFVECSSIVANGELHTMGGGDGNVAPKEMDPCETLENFAKCAFETDKPETVMKALQLLQKRADDELSLAQLRQYLTSVNPARGKQYLSDEEVDHLIKMAIQTDCDGFVECSSIVANGELHTMGGGDGNVAPKEMDPCEMLENFAKCAF